MKKIHRDDHAPAMLEALIDEIAVDAHGDDETLQAFQQSLTDHIVVPCDALVIGEPISVIAFAYDGNTRRGLTARCRRADGTGYVVAAADVRLPPRTVGGRYLAAYCRWLGLESTPAEAPRSRHRTASTKPRPPT